MPPAKKRPAKKAPAKKAPAKKAPSPAAPVEPPAPAAPKGYPASLTIDYPEELNRWTTAFRPILALPLFLLASLISNVAGLLFLPPLFLILFRQKYPRWWFDWNFNMLGFLTRIEAYALLLRDEYPSTDEQQAVHFGLDRPNVKRDLNRWLPLVKWFLAIPHLFILAFLHAAVVVVTIIAWFAILFTGRYPQGMFDFVVGVFRWTLRVVAYAFALTTDRYPPFSLQP